MSVYSGQSPGLGSRNRTPQPQKRKRPVHSALLSDCQLFARTNIPSTNHCTAQYACFAAHLSIMSTSVALFEHDITTGCTCELGIILAKSQAEMRCVAEHFVPPACSALHLHESLENDQPNTSTCATAPKGLDHQGKTPTGSEFRTCVWDSSRKKANKKRSYKADMQPCLRPAILYSFWKRCLP